MRVASSVVLAVYIVASTVQAEEYRYIGSVVRVIDGDSLVVDVPEWPAPFRPMRVRATGVNSPESSPGQGLDRLPMGEHLLPRTPSATVSRPLSILEGTFEARGIFLTERRNS